MEWTQTWRPPHYNWCHQPKEHPLDNNIMSKFSITQHFKCKNPSVRPYDVNSFTWYVRPFKYIYKANTSDKSNEQMQNNPSKSRKKKKQSSSVWNFFWHKWHNTGRVWSKTLMQKCNFKLFVSVYIFSWWQFEHENNKHTLNWTKANSNKSIIRANTATK